MFTANLQITRKMWNKRTKLNYLFINYMFLLTRRHFADYNYQTITIIRIPRGTGVHHTTKRFGMRELFFSDTKTERFFGETFQMKMLLDSGEFAGDSREVLGEVGGRSGSDVKLGRVIKGGL